MCHGPCYVKPLSHYFRLKVISTIKTGALSKGPLFWVLLCLLFVLPIDIDLIGLAGDLNRTDRYGSVFLVAYKASQ